MPAPFTDLPEPRPRGAYLHWYLPNGLTSGTADGPHEQATLPADPRSLARRCGSRPADSRRAPRGARLGARSRRRAGDRCSTSTAGPSRRTPPDVENPLTALGHGDLSWAGYFDNVARPARLLRRHADGDQVRRSARLPRVRLVLPIRPPTRSAPRRSPRWRTSTRRWQQLGWTLEAGQLDEVTPPAAITCPRRGRCGLDSTIDERIAATDASPDHRRRPRIHRPTARGGRPRACCTGRLSASTGPASEDTQEVGGPPDPSEHHGRRSATRWPRRSARRRARQRSARAGGDRRGAAARGRQGARPARRPRPARRAAARELVRQPAGRSSAHRAGDDRAERPAAGAARQPADARAWDLRRRQQAAAAGSSARPALHTRAHIDERGARSRARRPTVARTVRRRGRDPTRRSASAIDPCSARER